MVTQESVKIARQLQKLEKKFEEADMWGKKVKAARILKKAVSLERKLNKIQQMRYYSNG